MEEARLQKEVEAQEKKIRKEVERQEALRRKVRSCDFFLSFLYFLFDNEMFMYVSSDH